MTRVLVCGGRNYEDWKRVFLTLNEVHRKTPITIIVEGGALGVDRMARSWATFFGIDVETFEADWRRFGYRAGPIRNSEMAQAHIDLCVAFPGGSGTADMVRKIKAAGIKLLEVSR